ncbi:hypothetical protein BRE01_42910 [Brevibacillus reuszeri]|uniref:Uncharacterized protein n=1 Tax=Brevibacillus reuszeri TaxID=54915 RepID=A0A0K9YUQ2_9BACL|nr:hypothetical protein [Brevibacillus reuszeri]KNB72438.1 hypothetical protein ADS79_11225 [Brevibacillus reuszeri]MED1860896.1 hypothetical protein [Brevibacillus reuszeri]GED70589.1 hypothetical protein BRE01_42910 [Brevibacillus reuszeri]
MRHMYGVELHVPAGKLPGFYAQVIHKIGDHVNVFDRDKLLFIVETTEEREKLEAILTKSSMLGDVFSLLLLPASAELAHLDDSGFISPNENMYLYAEIVSMFTLTAGSGSVQDRWAAIEQLQEHLLGMIPQTDDEAPVYIIDRNLAELAEGIVRAYQIPLTWLHHES